MNVEQAVAEISGIEEFPGLHNAWRWSPTPRFVFSLALDVDNNRLYQVNTLDSFDEGLVREVLRLSRQSALGQGQQAQQFVISSGFEHEPYGFDTIAAVPPAIHQYYTRRNEALNEATIGVFPAYRCEFSGDETRDEAMYRFKRMLHPAMMSRNPAPYLRMRFENTDTGVGSIGPSRGFATPDVLLRELKLIEGAAGSFVEFENFRHEVWRIEWNGIWNVNGSAQGDPVTETWVLNSLGCPS
ncbi:hypothetical protein [Streptomyces sp. NPDC004050]